MPDPLEEKDRALSSKSRLLPPLFSGSRVRAGQAVKESSELGVKLGRCRLGMLFTTATAGFS